MKIGVRHVSSITVFMKTHTCAVFGHFHNPWICVSGVPGQCGHDGSCSIFMLCRTFHMYKLFLIIDICISRARGTVEDPYTELITLAALLGRKVVFSSFKNSDPFIRWVHLL